MMSCDKEIVIISENLTQFYKGQRDKENPPIPDGCKQEKLENV